MKHFINENFLLNSKTAVKLYHNYAKDMPIFDYHCHLDPEQIAVNKQFNNMTELWLAEDHYKWRLLRSNGVEEKYITGFSEDKEKFMKWAETMPYCLGNPIYHWTHLELKRYFGIDELLGPDTAEHVWECGNRMLNENAFSARELIKRSNVKVICTTDDPVDTLIHHIAISKDKDFDVRVLPTFRPDKCINVEKEGFTRWIERLGKAAGGDVDSFIRLKATISNRIEFFHSVGCRLSDHSLEPVVFCEATDEEAEAVFQKALNGRTLTLREIEKYKTQVMTFLGREYHRLGWTMQLHMGALRNNNERMFGMLGPDKGFDTIGDSCFASNLAKLLNNLDNTDQLPKTILYCLNPRDNEVLGAMMGCFQGGGIAGKIQFGSGWWFNDQKDGIIRQITALSNLGLLRRFVGMLTDSRSFLSYTRHEYFRRILCDVIGQWAERGEIPSDPDLLGDMVRDICYNNAVRYFGI